MSDDGYNGWKNYPTWAVNLWLSNDEGLYREAVERTKEAIEIQERFRETERAKGKTLIWTDDESRRYSVADDLKAWVEYRADLDEASFRSDLLGYALDCVDWHEVADAWIEMATGDAA